MNVMIFGHIYVRDLCQLLPVLREFVLEGSHAEIKVFYKYFPGKDFN